MKAGWQVKPLGEVCEVVNGGTPKTGVKEYWGNEHLWITPAEMGKRLSPYADDTARKITSQGLRDSSARLLPLKSVILSSRAPIGHLVINTKPMATNQGCKGLVPNGNLAYKYLFYFLQANVDLLNDLGSGATFKELSGGKLKEVKIPLAPLSEQQRIAAILDQAFEGIAKARANAEQNLRNARALFESHLQSVFSVRGEPVEPHHPSTSSGRTGERWTNKNLVALSDLATDITDGDHMPPPKAETGVPFITIGNIVKHTRTIDFTDTFKVPFEYFNKLKANKRPKVGDVLYTVTGSFGIPVLVKDNQEFCFQRHIGLIRPKSDVSSEWLCYLLSSPQLLKQANDGATGTAQKTVSLKVLRSFQVPRLSLDEQNRMVVELDALSKETQRLEALYQRKIKLLDELKKSLLQQAFAGEL